MASSSGTTSSNNMIEDHVKIFVAYNGEWEWDDKEWFFKDSKGSIMVVSKYVTLSQITDILCKKLNIDQDSCVLKLEVHYRVGSPWFPIIEIECDEDLSLFISESSKTKLPLCVTPVLKDDVVEGLEQDDINPDIIEEFPHGPKDPVRIFVAYGGEWEWDGKELFFKDSEGSIMVVSKYVTLTQITDILCTKFDVDQDSYGLKLEIHYRVGSPWFPTIEIESDEDLSLFISESLKTKLLLCVTRMTKAVVRERAVQHEINPDIIEEHGHRGNSYDMFINRIEKTFNLAYSLLNMLIKSKTIFDN